jgi:hypothetical protein
VRRTTNIASAKTADGIQIQMTSCAMTAAPRAVTNRYTLIGDTRIGRHGKK